MKRCLFQTCINLIMKEGKNLHSKIKLAPLIRRSMIGMIMLVALKLFQNSAAVTDKQLTNRRIWRDVEDVRY